MVKFIADVGSNHNRDLDRIYCLTKTAKEVGCWAVKFQLFRPDDLYRELTPERRAAFPRNPIIYSCRADYPARPEDCMFDSYFFMNWSDHTVEPGVIYSAVGRCAEYIEFHLDIEDMAGNESKHGHVWNPSKIRDVIRTVRVMENSWWSSDHRDYDYNDTNKRADPIDGKRPRILR